MKLAKKCDRERKMSVRFCVKLTDVLSVKGI